MEEDFGNTPRLGDLAGPGCTVLEGTGLEWSGGPGAVERLS